MADKTKVGKKKRIIAGAIAGAVVLSGAGVGVGVGLLGGEMLPPPPHRVEFVIGDSGLDKVYGTDGQEIKVEDLKVGDVIQFPKPAQTFIGQGEVKEYFVGWSANRESTVPTFFVGDETITITESVKTLHAIYMQASLANLTFAEIDEETCTVAYNNEAINESFGGILVIPNEHEGKRVVAVGERLTAKQQYDLETLIASNNSIINSNDKTEEEKQAAREAKEAAEAELATVLAAAANKASVKKIVLARGIEKIDSYAFYNCEELTNISFVSDEYVVEGSVQGMSVIIEEDSVVTEIGSHVFENCEKLEAVVLPKEVTKIGSYAFKNCFSGARFSVEAGSKLATLEEDSFRGAGFATIDLTGCEDLTQIGARSFLGCPDLKEIGLPDNTYSVFGKEMFYNSKKLERISTDLSDAENYKMPTNISGTIDNWFRECESLQKIELPKGIEEVLMQAFLDCKSLKSIIFHEDTNMSKFKVDYIKSTYATYYTEYLYTSIFKGCESLEEIELPMGWQVVDILTFSGCVNLKKVTFKDPTVHFRAALSGAKSQVFYDCTSLETVEFAEGASVECFHYNSNWRLGDFGMRYDLYDYIGGLFASCSSLKYVGIPNAQGVIEENSLPGCTGNIHNRMFGGTAIENFTVPATATVIDQFAFIGCLELGNIVIPNTVTKIGQRAFESTGLVDVIIPENVTEIGYRAFQQIATLKSITFNCKNLATVGGDAFQPFYTAEKFTDANDNAKWDEGEAYEDANQDGEYTMTQPVPSQLEKITFGENVQTLNFVSGIWSNAVASHKALKTIEFKGAVPPTTANNLPWTYVEKIIVPVGSVEAYKTAFADYATLVEGAIA